MNKLSVILLTYLCTALVAPGQAADTEVPQLPAWQVLEFEEQAFWATARSRVEITAAPTDEQYWELEASSSVVDNSEQVLLSIDPTSGRVHKRSRLSQGRDQRLKSFDYQADYILRERRDPGANPAVPPEEWPMSSSKKISYPASATDSVVTNPYVLLLLAGRLQAQGPGTSAEVLVHTDLNFYRVRLTCGNGIPITVDYQVTGDGSVSGKRDTLAVVLHISPEGTLEEKADFSLFGLYKDIILFFDRSSGLPLQVRGIAPRIGATEINLKSVTMRAAQP